MTEFFKEFQEFRKILCICPCCNNIVRVSDLHLKTKGMVTKTWLDKFEEKERRLEKKEEIFQEKELKLREKAREKGRKGAEKIFNECISPKFKSMELDPFDIKPILNPIDFVVFKGMNKTDSVNDIVFLSKQINNPHLNQIRQQVKKVISQKKYEWQVARIDNQGMISFE